MKPRGKSARHAVPGGVLTAYVIPGFRQTARSKAYRRIMHAFREVGVRAVGVDIKWQRSTMSRYVKEFIGQVRQETNGNYFAFGFSYGAMAALIASAGILRPRRLFLCSLSPYFAEFLSKDRIALVQTLGKRRLEDFNTFRLNGIARKVRARTEIFVGSAEAKSVIRAATHTKRLIPGARLVVVKNASHDLANESYLNAVIKRIQAIKSS
jgi:pimeloyl-ACP methyl ester carboxylesterase